MTNRRSVLAGLLFCLSLVLPAIAVAGGDWNDGGIAWRPLDEGLAEAKKEGKPVCLVVYTEWCPHCTKYSKVFHDPAVVEKSKRFVMIRIDKDKRAMTAHRYAPSGDYVPRTIFLAPDGEIRKDVTAKREDYPHFYDENDPAALLAGMDAALAEAKKAA
ncbi:MAG: thioredoxin family protein [Alphaproteobacteria bacterium]